MYLKEKTESNAYSLLKKKQWDSEHPGKGAKLKNYEYSFSHING